MRGTNTLLMVCQGKPDQLSGKVASDLHTYFDGLFSVPTPAARAHPLGRATGASGDSILSRQDMGRAVMSVHIQTMRHWCARAFLLVPATLLLGWAMAPRSTESELAQVSGQV